MTVVEAGSTIRGPVESARERRRSSQAAAIERVALALFATHGFAAVTVDQIAAACDISRRTFFRYFASKEDVLLGDRKRFEETLARALEQLGPGESAVRALRNALIALSREATTDPQIIQLRLRLFRQSPESLLAAFEQQRTYQGRLTPLMARHMAMDAENDLRPGLVVSILMAAAYAATRHWLVTGAKSPLHELVTQALDQALTGVQGLDTT